MSGSIGDTRFSTGGARLQVLAAALTFSIGGAGIKACQLTSWQVTSFRSGIAALTLLLLLPEARKGWNARAALVGVAYAATVTLFVLANKLTTSANTIFLQSTAPLYILLLSPWLLRERIHARDVLVMAVVALGMSLLFVGTEHPYATAPDPVRGNVLATLAGFSWALTLMGLRWMGRHEGGSAAPVTPDSAAPATPGSAAPATPGSAAPATPGSAAPAVVIGNLMAFFLALPFALPVQAARPLDWALVTGLGTIQIGIAYIFLTKGMRHVRALEASMLLLLEPVLNPVWSWLIHGERPRAWPLVGGAIILGGTLAKTWVDSRQRGEETT
ncbi:MAG TPA: EamA family transporter [Candidatus Eisenbacteria bacterium]|nr:EamA family transporter [Candidatus Eisenbacteria bacterium]